MPLGETEKAVRGDEAESEDLPVKTTYSSPDQGAICPPDRQGGQRDRALCLPGTLEARHTGHISDEGPYVLFLILLHICVRKGEAAQ